MNKPVRIQRSRKKGWRMPPNTVYVGRPTKWGNPYRVGKYGRFLLTEYAHLTPEQAVDFYKYYWIQRVDLFSSDAQKELKGKNLACWCPLNKPCHADFLLKIANEK